MNLNDPIELIEKIKEVCENSSLTTQEIGEISQAASKAMENHYHPALVLWSLLEQEMVANLANAVKETELQLRAKQKELEILKQKEADLHNSLANPVVPIDQAERTKMIEKFKAKLG